MEIRPRRALACAAVAAGALAATVPAALAAVPDPGSLTNVPGANPRAGSPANVLSPELTETVRAAGANAIESPLDLRVPLFGYDAFTAPAVLTQGTPEAQKTEPDKNTYLVLDGQTGPTAGADYGRRFLFQGHEAGTPGAITRINLDADPAHRVTLMATRTQDGKDLPDFDGSTWDPWAGKLLFTAENGNKGGVWQATPGYPSKVDDISGALGRGGYEGIQNDSDGNVWIVEDSGGKAGTTATHAKQPNSFLYRYVPYNRGDLTRGRLQALRVSSKRTGAAVTFTQPASTSAADVAAAAQTDILSAATKDVHTYGTPEKTVWVTIHDTGADGANNAPFDANALAKAAGATPFKRPENGQFRPGSKFRQFVFDETGDTNTLTEAGADYGGFGDVQVLSQKDPSADTGTLRLLYQGDVAHSGLDNVAFFDRDHVAFVEDAGDTMHAQRNALDSAYMFDMDGEYDEGDQPVRFLAEGRDPSATYDATHATQNDGDNEITGIHVSDGDPSSAGILGAKVPTPWRDGWRVFWTQQHGDNQVWEVLPQP